MTKSQFTAFMCLLAAIMLQCSCATHSSSDTPLIRKFSVNPILKKQDDTLSTSSGQITNYELDGVVGTATVNLSD